MRVLTAPLATIISFSSESRRASPVCVRAGVVQSSRQEAAGVVRALSGAHGPRETSPHVRFPEEKP